MSFVARCFLAEMSKTGCYTIVVCCEVKILHSEQSPGPNAASNSFRGERGPAFVSFFFSCVSFPRFVAWPLELGLGTLNPRFVAWPLELGLGTRNPRFVACMVVESRNQLLGRRQKELAAKTKQSEKGNNLKRPYGSGHPVWRAKRWQANEGW